MEKSTASTIVDGASEVGRSSTHIADSNIATRSSVIDAPVLEDPPNRKSPSANGLQFWLVMLSLMVSTFLSALDLTSVSTALPTIVRDLHGTDFTWVGSSYALGSTAFLPASGALADVFGRQSILLGSLAFFAAGSTVCGAAVNLNMLIAGRAIQGVGGGGIVSLTMIVIADLVPLRQRGAYNGLIGGVYAVASAAGPVLGGAFSQSQWRWLFYMNLPLTAVAAVLVVSFLRLKVPGGKLGEKLKAMDWAGNILVVAATTSCAIALTWAGVQHPWSSWQVLVPLILGLAGFIIFFGYEAKVAKEPVVPWQLINKRTSLSGYLSYFLHGIVMTAVVFYLPVYFQGSRLQDPIRSGISTFGVALTVAPSAIANGISVRILGRYRPQIFLGWGLVAIGVGLMSTVMTDTSVARMIGFQILTGVGLGILFSGPIFPVLAALPVSETAHAVALSTFVRNFAQTWGVTIGSTVLQNELHKNLPATFFQTFGSEGVETAYALIPQVPSMPDELRQIVRDAFASSMRVVWIVMASLSALGFITVAMMEELKMHEVTDDRWGLDDEKDKAKATDTIEKV